MRLDLEGNWGPFLLLGGFLFLLFVLAGLVISSIFGLFVWILRGVGTLLGTLVGFAFQSLFHFLLVAGLLYLGYWGYNYLKEERREKRGPTRYTEDDFEKGDGKGNW
ncbi:MAG: hypothetical protein ACOC9A_01695 [Candidatus Bipolaricaulota bacterium]